MEDNIISDSYGLENADETEDGANPDTESGDTPVTDSSGPVMC